MSEQRIINLTAEEAYMCDQVLGQLSDGKWENSPSMEKYWYNFAVNGTDLIVSRCEHGYRGFLANPLWNKTDVEIKSWFADKLKAVVKDFVDDWGGSWDRICDKPCAYLDNVSIAEAYKVYDSLKGRADKTGKIVKRNVIKHAAEILVGDRVGKKTVKSFHLPFTTLDRIVTIIYDNGEVDRLNVLDAVSVTEFHTIQ